MMIFSPPAAELPILRALTRSGKRVGIHNLDGGGRALSSMECKLRRGLAESLGRYPLSGLPPIIVVCRGGDEAATFFARRLSKISSSWMKRRLRSSSRLQLLHVSRDRTSANYSGVRESA